MKKLEFLTELKQDLQHIDFISLRSFYTAVIGNNAVSLYSLLYDYHFMNRGRESYIPFDDLAITLGVSESELINERKKLEAVGLIRTFEKADNYHIIILINKPLDAQSFRKNSLLYKSAVSKLGELIYERVEFSSKTKEYSKSEFAEVTTKYQDMFDFSEKTSKTTSTLEIPVSTVKSKEDAINGLVPTQFVNYLTGERVSESQIATFQQIQNLGFSSKSVNLIIDYSYEVNGKIVANYIRTIANDLFEKNVKGAEGVKLELQNAISARKKPVKVEVGGSESTSAKLFDKEDNRTWDELFDSLGGGL